MRKKSAAMLASRVPAVPAARAFVRRWREGLLAVRGQAPVAGVAEMRPKIRRTLSGLP